MSTVRLSDVVVPEVFSKYENTNTMENFRLYQSGALVDDSELAKQLQGGGRLFQVPAWKDLDDTESNIGSDDPNQESTPLKLGSIKDQTVRHNRNQVWSTMRLSRELAGSDPMKRIASRVSEYWKRQYNAHFVRICRGVIADNVANDSGDMVNDISTQSTISDSNRISAEAIIDTRLTMGDAGEDGLAVLMMHSQMKAKLDKLDLIDYIRDSKGMPIGNRYGPYEVVESDTCYVNTSGSNPVYDVYLVGHGAFGWAQKSLPANEATEVERKPSQGNGQGGDELYSRKQFVMHPYGIKWTDSVCTEESPSWSELINASNWDRVYPERKQIKFACLRVNA